LDLDIEIRQGPAKHLLVSRFARRGQLLFDPPTGEIQSFELALLLDLFRRQPRSRGLAL